MILTQNDLLGQRPEGVPVLVDGVSQKYSQLKNESTDITPTQQMPSGYKNMQPVARKLETV